MNPQGNAPISARDLHAKARFNMVEGQIRTNRVSDAKLLAVLSDLPRQVFVPAAFASIAYVDTSIRIAQGRYLLEPLVLSRLIQEAVVNPEDKVLIVGAGTGYSAAILAKLAASVVAVESDPDLAQSARTNLLALGDTNAQVVAAPLTDGCAEHAPYDIILIDGMIAELPSRISDQLADMGRLVTIQAKDGGYGAGMLYRKLGGIVSGRALFDATTPFLPGFAPEPAFAF
jgi:protein-L-isoaspartate(D-aspartate) O-methyltransferase